MKARCPNNKDHKEFITVAHVMQDWKVTEQGEFIEVVTECLDVSFRPDVHNTWTCAICGAEAVVENN